MKPINRILLITLSVFFLFPASVLPQSDPATELHSVLEGMISKYQDFRILGWSRKGEAALLQWEDGGLRGGYAIHFLIFDTISDRVLFQEELWSDDLVDQVPEGGSMAQVMARSREAGKFLETCKTRGIRFAKSVEPSKFPLKRKGAKYGAEIVFQSRTENESDDPRWKEAVADFQVVVIRNGTSRKVISRQKGVRLREASVVGYFASPLEERILVIYRTAAPGVEGEMSTTFYLSGCHLAAGFK